jgi:TRAP-type mannitol/chloroaromatic compound transport system substrate-binding protein
LNRRDFLKGGVAVGGAVAISGCTSSEVESVNINRGKKVRLRLATSWPDSFPIMGTGVERFARRVEVISGGSLIIKVYPKNRLVPPLAVFDTTSIGQLDIFHSGPYYWKGKNSAFSIFGGVPFGMTPDESVGWFRNGDGLELWRELYGKHNLYPLLGGNTGPQMGGWFRKAINRVEDLDGLKMRIPGLAGELFSRLGVNSVLLPAGEIFMALERGTLDATEWVGPALDKRMGFHKVAKHYYSGWNEPGSILELTFNKSSWENLSSEHKEIIEVASNELHSEMSQNFHYENGLALQELQKDSSIKIGSFPDEVTKKAKSEFDKLIDRLTSENSDFRRVWDSYSSYQSVVRQWTDLSVKSYLNER